METRERILRSARDLLEQEPGVAVSMAQVAKQAGVSRQALYLHFADRAELLVEVSRIVDASERTPERQQRIDQAPTARDALREAVALQAWLKPRLRAVASALDILRRTDQAAAAAWREREQARLERCRLVVDRLHDEEQLQPTWTVDEAARWLWALTSQHVWEDLVIDQGWTDDQYRIHVTTILETALLRHQ